MQLLCVWGRGRLESLSVGSDGNQLPWQRGHPVLSVALARSQIVTGRQTGNEFSISHALSLAHLAGELPVCQIQ